MRYIAFFVATAALSSCAKPAPTPEQQLIQEAHDAVRGKLKDPESARFKEESTYFVVEHGAICGGKVNSKNGFGGYNGDEEYIYIRGKGATLIEDGPDQFSAAVETCGKLLAEQTKQMEAQTRKIVSQMDPATRAEFERMSNQN